MPTVSKHTTDTVNEYPVATDRFSELDGYTVNFVDITETHSLAPMLASLPDREGHAGGAGRLIAHQPSTGERFAPTRRHLDDPGGGPPRAARPARAASTIDP